MLKVILSIVLCTALFVNVAFGVGQTVELDFSGLQVGESVRDYFAGGFGSLGSGPGPNYGIVFLDFDNSSYPGFVVDLSNPQIPSDPRFDGVRDSVLNPAVDCGRGVTKGYWKFADPGPSVPIYSSLQIPLINYVGLRSTGNGNDANPVTLTVGPQVGPFSAPLYPPANAVTELDARGCTVFNTTYLPYDMGYVSLTGTGRLPYLLSFFFQFRPDTPCEPAIPQPTNPGEFLITFNGLQIGEKVQSFFNGGSGSKGSTALSTSNYGLLATAEGGFDVNNQPCPEAFAFVQNSKTCACSMGAGADPLAYHPAYVLQSGRCNTRLEFTITSNYIIDAIEIYLEHFSGVQITPAPTNLTSSSILPPVCRRQYWDFLTNPNGNRTNRVFTVQVSSVDIATFSAIKVFATCPATYIWSTIGNGPYRCVCPTGYHEVFNATTRVRTCVLDCTDPQCCVNFDTPKADGASCSDGNACTVGDVCRNVTGGIPTCRSGAPLTCADSGNQCLEDGVCNPSTGSCSYANKVDNTPCNDGLFCSQTDLCLSGTCTGTNFVTCSSSGQCFDAGVCSEQLNGACTNPPSVAGTSCNDNNACTLNDQCDGAGACTVNTPVACAAADQCHQPGVCQPSTGTCTYDNKLDGTTCDDGLFCTQTDTCQTGVCTGGNPVTCTALGQCFDAGVCSEQLNGACTNPPSVAGTSCNDNNACTLNDRCDGAGACTVNTPFTCAAPTQCQEAGVCDPLTGVCSYANKPNGTSCNDGLPCTQTDVCLAGVCVGTNPVVCPAADQCHQDGVCNQNTGVCEYANKPDNTGCNDGLFCTQTDVCLSGSCVGTNNVVCTSISQCHDAGVCQESLQGQCTNPPKALGSSCNDANPCTLNDQCNGQGSCSVNTPFVCAAPSQCHEQGVCNPSTGTCDYADSPLNTPCNDGNFCTQTDVCVSGSCVGENPVVCTASDQCHVAGVCVNGANGFTCTNPAIADNTPCTDNNPCTLNDVCMTGVCVSGSMKSCPAPGQCYNDGVCNNSTGACVDMPKSSGSSCEISLCHDNDACDGAGTCIAGTPKVCPRGDNLQQCSPDSACDPSTGLCTVSVPLPDGTPCTDSNLCTVNDTCVSGQCTAGHPMACAAKNECRRPGVCNGQTGSCSNGPILANGSPCTTCNDDEWWSGNDGAWIAHSDRDDDDDDDDDDDECLCWNGYCVSAERLAKYLNLNDDNDNHGSWSNNDDSSNDDSHHRRHNDDSSNDDSHRHRRHNDDDSDDDDSHHRNDDDDDGRRHRRHF
eukprot:TRINITY_DN1852_c0_g1_i1.p1 TRINITY_DN1852_c0_g1~~TRINITY_DN1852_c0_g1_i1.p1  ORF type:complete len:1265 (-),score=419.45 TRINITY_DN1852_c0_g1_i1:829-4623(-)